MGVLLILQARSDVGPSSLGVKHVEANHRYFNWNGSDTEASHWPEALRSMEANYLPIGYGAEWDCREPGPEVATSPHLKAFY